MKYDFNELDADKYPVWINPVGDKIMEERNVIFCAKPEQIHRASYAYGRACCAYDALNHAGWGWIFEVFWNKVRRTLRLK